MTKFIALSFYNYDDLKEFKNVFYEQLRKYWTFEELQKYILVVDDEFYYENIKDLENWDIYTQYLNEF